MCSLGNILFCLLRHMKYVLKVLHLFTFEYYTLFGITLGSGANIMALSGKVCWSRNFDEESQIIWHTCKAIVFSKSEVLTLEKLYFHHLTSYKAQLFQEKIKKIRIIYWNSVLRTILRKNKKTLRSYFSKKIFFPAFRRFLTLSAIFVAEHKCCHE